MRTLSHTEVEDPAKEALLETPTPLSQECAPRCRRTYRSPMNHLVAKNTAVFLLVGVMTGCGSGAANNPEPASSETAAAEPVADGAAARACSEITDCTVVPGPCGSWAAFSAAWWEHHAFVPGSSCIPGEPAASVPTTVACENNVCETVELDHPEWRACRTAADCVAVHDVCGRADAVNRASEAAKRAAVTEMAMRVRCMSTTEGPLPTPVCRASFCAPY